ncbi:unnamed protein product [Rhizoctonia solani]|uniref:RBR-type E3 ubiquitin transferase n=1 Tax=Rhizoctonia solani TaxID=456999 RepID=A0A8H2X306_9AGAM|nr:unnamed protein product [Rhizoctonia solani]
MTMPGFVLWSFDGPPDEANQSPLPSPPPSTRPSYRDVIMIDSDSDMEPEVFHDASPVISGGSNNISGPTSWSSLQKVEPPSTPPTTPPNPDPRTNPPNRDSATTPNTSPQTTLIGGSPPRTPSHTTPHIERTSTDVVQQILSGERHSATFQGTSQYAAGGTSACGLASMNAIRLTFELCSRRIEAEDLVSALVSEQFIRAAMGIATYWPNNMHLEVEPILQLPLFSSTIRTLDDQYAECTYRTFSNAIVALRFDEHSPGPRAVCLTRPPEVISVMHIPIPQPTAHDWAPWTSRRVDSIYLVFDSHPRPNHPNGAAVQIFPPRPMEDVAEYLMDLFQVDQDIINDPNLEWTAQLFGQLSYHVLAPSLAPELLDEYALNMRILEADRKRNWAEEKLKAAEAETRKLRSTVFDKEQEIAMLNFNNRRKQDEVQSLKAQLNRPLPPPPREEPRTTSWLYGGNRTGESSKSKGKRRDNSGSWQNSPLKEETRYPSWFANDTRGGEGSGSSGKGQGNLGGSKTNTGSRTSGTSDFGFSQWNRGPPRPPSDVSAVSPKASGSSGHRTVVKDEEEARSLELAFRLQREFDHETTQFSMGESLAKSMERSKFDCGICMEEYTDEAIARIDACGHSSCRDCMRSNIQSKIEERRYPIPCPFCVAGSNGNDASGQRGVGTIPVWVVETIGISPELFTIYTEMQLAEHSIMIDCRGKPLFLDVCSGSAFVDRKDYDRAEIITCPMPRCTYAWCKQCNQAIQGGAKHSCDGSAELETLMHQRGWKHCPGCRTPIERSMGCNHMTCTSPGCNMHFCYKCGAVVITGGTRSEIQAAVASHYRTCALFDVPRDS